VERGGTVERRQEGVPDSVGKAEGVWGWNEGRGDTEGADRVAWGRTKAGGVPGGVGVERRCGGDGAERGSRTKAGGGVPDSMGKAEGARGGTKAGGAQRMQAG